MAGPILRTVRSDPQWPADLANLAGSGEQVRKHHRDLLTALEKAKRAGARIIAVNPLPEAGLLDVAPTVLGAAGLATSVQMMGHSVVPAWKGPCPPWWLAWCPSP